MKVLLFLLFLCTPLPAAEFFVNKDGLDVNPGTSRKAAFLTIQKGLDALTPGDTLTIGRGEYTEAVARKGLGSAEKVTVIRAEKAATVLLRGDLDAPVFKPLPGTRQTFVADYRGEVEAVYEVDTLNRRVDQVTLNFMEDGKNLGHTRMSLAEYQKRVSPTDSLIADPQFPALTKLDPSKLAKFPIDSLVSPFDFEDLFTQNPELMKRGIGLQVQAFADMLTKETR